MSKTFFFMTVGNLEEESSSKKGSSQKEQQQQDRRIDIQPAEDEEGQCFMFINYNYLSHKLIEIFKKKSGNNGKFHLIENNS